MRSLPGIIRANIYSPDGFIRHSTEANLIGVHFSDNADLAKSFEGLISTSLETAEASSKPEHLALNQLEGERIVESYIPVTGKDGKVAAVVEFYRRDDWVGETVSSITRAVWLAAGLSSAILALTLLLAFRPRAAARPT